ncbi:NgoPII family restriction endonuclease [Glaesserella sp.]|uniref:NgoPII family restriction endonuclease n=1 Tax=Glaesserella sp. TaxID=2094731 RepID=UPI0035A073A6
MNIINAIINLVNNPITELVQHYQSRNRANQAGDALEEYVKDLFADTFMLPENQRLEKLSETFSYLGNNSNPPDAMLNNGDAIEVKKIENNHSALALNSSYPKAKLFSHSPMISTACRNAENWTEKDIIYAVGVVDGTSLKHLCMVYGEDYFPDEQFYQFPIDPLGIAVIKNAVLDFKNPIQCFDYIYRPNEKKSFNFMSIINTKKWETLTNRDILFEIPNLIIKDVFIKAVNTNKQKIAKLITYSI